MCLEIITFLAAWKVINGDKYRLWFYIQRSDYATFDPEILEEISLYVMASKNVFLKYVKARFRIIKNTRYNTQV